MLAPIGKVGDARREPIGVQAEAQHVDGGLEQARRRAGQQTFDRSVGGDQLPVAVDGERGIGLVALEDEFDGAPGRLELRILQPALRELGREARRDQQHVAIPQGNLEALGKVQNHIAARL
jgi:hypothetical protein